MRRQSVGKPAFLTGEVPTVERFHGGEALSETNPRQVGQAQG